MTLAIGLLWFVAVTGLAEFRQPLVLDAAVQALDAGFNNALPILSAPGAIIWLETLAKIGWAVAVALAVQGACLASGTRTAGWMTGRARPVDAVAAWLLGAGGIGLGLLGLGLVGLFDRVVLSALSLVLLGPIGGWNAVRQFRIPGSPVSGRLGVLARLAALGALGVTAVTLLCPETGVDSLIYHMAIPGRTLQLHRVVAMPSNFLTVVPALSEMLRGWTLGLGGEPAARLWSAAALAAGGAAIFEIVHAAAAPVGSASLSYGAGETWGWVAAAIWLTSPWLADLARAGKPDLWIAPLALVGFGCLNGGGSRSGIVAGVLGGLAASIKPAGMAAGAALVPALAFSRRLRVPALGWAMVGAAGAVCAWAVRAWVLTGAPAYPFGSGKFGMTSEAVAAMLEYSRTVAVRGHYASWLQRLASPWTATFTDALPAFWLAAVPLAVLSTSRGHVARVLALAGGLGWMAWLAGPPQARYAMPALAWLAAAGALGLAAAADHLPRLTGGLAGTLLVLQAGRGLLGAATSGALVAGTGLEEPEAYRVRTLGVYAELTARLRETLPARALVLFTGERRTFPAPYRTLAPSVYEPFPLLPAIRASATAEELTRRVRQLGVTHVIHNHVGALYVRELQTMEGWTARDLGVWAEYWRRHARLLTLPDRLDVREGGYYVYRIAAERDEPLPTPTLPGIEGIFAAIEGRMRRGEAQAVAEQAAALEQVAGDFAEVNYMLGEIWFAQDPYQAAAYLKKADAGEFRHLELWATLARRAEEQWRLDEALAWHQRIQQFEPRAVGAEYRRVLGKLIGGARKRRRPEEAERYIRMALEITPSDAALWSELCEMLLWLGRRGEAIEAIQQAIRLNPQHGGYRGTYGHLMRAS